MPRKSVGWEDETIQPGFGDSVNRDKQFRGKKGCKQIIRILSDAEVYRVHGIDDVLEPKEDGEPSVFNMNCSKTWSDEEDDWVGDCLACDRDYEVGERYICGLVLVAEQRGKKWQQIDPENSVMYWDFGADKYRKLSDIALELKRADSGKKKKRTLKHIEIVVTCEDPRWQKLDLQISQSDPISPAKYVAAYKAEGPDLVEEASSGYPMNIQKRKLKPNKKKRAPDPEESLEEEEEEEPTPRKAKKASPKKAAPRKAKKAKKPEPEPEDEPEDEEESDEDLDDLLDELD